MMHQALDDSDQTRKYGISESMIQALYYDIVCNKVIIRACIMESEAVEVTRGEWRGSGMLSGVREKATAVTCTWAAPGELFWGA